MIKLEKVVQRFYEGLEEGKFLGRKCPVCGNVEFPPVYACNKCGRCIKICPVGALSKEE